MKLINLARIDFGGITGGKSKPEEVFDVQPTTTDQTITPSEGSVFSGGTVRAVTSDIDVNIVSNNIKEGVTILGVAGTLKEVKPEESFNVQPTTAEQTITPSEGKVFSRGTVHAVTSEIDNNIVPGNIKQGVSILGVAGTLKEEKPEESFNVQPTTAEQTITPTEGSVFSGGTVHAVTSSIDSNIQPENIKEGVSILGVAGTLSEGVTPAGTIAINLNGTYDVTNYASAEVYVGDTPDYRYAKGTIDRAGLKAIGWTDEDILTFEQNISPHYPWQNDQYKVSDENKALYSLADLNPDSYKDNPNITFAPNKKLESYSSLEMKYIKGIPFYDTSSMIYMNNMFYNWTQLITIPQLNTSNATSMGWMFNNCSQLTTIPQLDTSNVTSMNSMFNGCRNLKTIPQLDTSNVTNMSNMFYDCAGLTAIPPLDTSKVTKMDYMFASCKGLTTIPQLNTSNVTDMSFMFGNCSNLATIPQLDTSKVTNMMYMFDTCTGLTTVEGIDFSGLTSELTNLFGWYSGLPNITRFIVNGKINVSIKDDYGIHSLSEIDYDSVKSILAAADRTDNTNAKTLAFNRTMTDQNGELAALVSSCTSKGWTISGLTLN